jgi:hypothetical protein
MSIELNKEYRIPRAKRVMLQGSAFILFSLGTLPSIPTSIILKSVLPILGGIFLAFLSYCLFILASHTMVVSPEGILLKSRKGERLLKWSDIHEIAQGKGIDRYKVTYTLMSEPPASRINLGLFYVSGHKVHQLPDTFSMKAKELAAFLEQTRKEMIQHPA